MKEHFPVTDWPPPITKVCSAGDCIASRPEGWIERWDFNRASCWDDEASALACVAPEQRENYRLYAFRAIPLVFDRSGVPTTQQPEELFYTDMPVLPPEPDLLPWSRRRVSGQRTVRQSRIRSSPPIERTRPLRDR